MIFPGAVLEPPRFFAGDQIFKVVACDDATCEKIHRDTCLNKKEIL